MMKYFWFSGSMFCVLISIYFKITNNSSDAWFLACGALWYVLYVDEKNREEN